MNQTTKQLSEIPVFVDMRVHGPGQFRETFGTHFVRTGKQFSVFNVEKCDRCDCTIMAPNPITIRCPEKLLLKCGVKDLKKQPDEGSLIEETGEVVCDKCWNEHEGVKA